ncbi:hypothetical protein ERO13_1Z049813v2, partial [Gossypium hirsutum]
FFSFESLPLSFLHNFWFGITGRSFESLPLSVLECGVFNCFAIICFTCRVNNRDSNSNDETSARASLSRIVMLAEALFEVLDEIPQQSVVLSSRPS